MNLRSCAVALAAAVSALLTPAAAPAFIVLVEYEDRNGTGGFPDNGGPHWKGFVDTAANTLTIQSWTDLAGTPEFWTPLWTPDLSALPLVWPAVAADGTPYDVPDDFLGDITSVFAFVSPVSAQNMVWNQGDWGFAGNFKVPPEIDFFPGWGGVRKPVQVSGQTVLVYDTTADETSMPMLPISNLGIAESTGALVTAKVAVTVQAIPEASPLLFGAAATLAVAGFVSARRDAQRRWERRGSAAKGSDRPPDPIVDRHAAGRTRF
jgi:hypothetical protein